MQGDYTIHREYHDPHNEALCIVKSLPCMFSITLKGSQKSDLRRREAFELISLVARLMWKS